jgi:hypothetical protein
MPVQTTTLRVCDGVTCIKRPPIRNVELQLLDLPPDAPAGVRLFQTRERWYGPVRACRLFQEATRPPMFKALYVG